MICPIRIEFFTTTRLVYKFFLACWEYIMIWFICQKMEIWQNPRYLTFRAKIIYLVKSDFLLPQDMYSIVFLPAEQILFHKNSWFPSQKMAIRQNSRYSTFRAKIIYLVKSNFFTATRWVFYSFLPTEQILLYKKNLSISQKMEIRQNSSYTTFRANIIYLVRSDFFIPTRWVFYSFFACWANLIL